MPKKTVTNETAAAAPALAAKPKTTRTAPLVAKPAAQPSASKSSASKPRVNSVKHSKAAAPAVIQTETVQAATVQIAPVNAHEAIAKIAYGYWEARGFQPGSPEQDWLRAEQEFLLQA